VLHGRDRYVLYERRPSLFIEKTHWGAPGTKTRPTNYSRQWSHTAPAVHRGWPVQLAIENTIAIAQVTHPLRHIGDLLAVDKH